MMEIFVKFLVESIGDDLTSISMVYEFKHYTKKETRKKNLTLKYSKAALHAKSSGCICF